PISLGYFAVAFSLGIMAKSCGLTPGQGFLASILTNASAGQYAGFTLIGDLGTYLEMAIMMLVINGRYILMSFAMSQRIDPNIKMGHRFLMSMSITDELFAIAIARPGYLNPNYSYGSFIVASPGWAIGTALGCIAGNIMPDRIVSALSVALFGMFLAVIIPVSKKSWKVAIVVIVSFILSFAFSVMPVISNLSSGNRTIILTVLISSLAALIFPRRRDTEDKTDISNDVNNSEGKAVND
ncbi:MAG: AzlC family ABC transporter permease, partial [Bacillota bacterium]|nr:AzlC family ABC transporter permease [Bacillota bacterium]